MKRNVAVTLLAVCVLTLANAPNALGQASPRPANLSEQTAKAVPPFKMFDNLYKEGESAIATKLIPRDMAVKDGDTLKLGNTTIKLYITPGHTPGVTSLEFPVSEGGKAYRVFMWPGPTLQSNELPVMEQFLATTKRLQTLTKGSEVWLHSHPWSVSFFEKYDKRVPGHRS